MWGQEFPLRAHTWPQLILQFVKHIFIRVGHCLLISYRQTSADKSNQSDTCYNNTIMHISYNLISIFNTCLVILFLILGQGITILSKS